MRALRLGAPAKLNLALAVTGRRGDLHELASVFVLLELHDTLVLAPDAPPRLRVAAPPGEPVPRDRGANLAWRGLAAGHGGEPSRGELRLEKRTPAAAGLGGGSSDAAAGWRLGRRLAGEAEEAADLATLLALGADVPFFASGCAAAYVSGIGERIAPLRAQQPMSVVIALPPFRLRTADVFAALRPGDWSEPPAPRAEPGRNDLLAAAVRLRPDLVDLHRLVERAGGEPHLTGSGPATFALSDDPERAGAVASALRGAGVATIQTRTATARSEVDEVEEGDAPG